jgi:hypothetical protein
MSPVKDKRKRLKEIEDRLKKCMDLKKHVDESYKKGRFNLVRYRENLHKVHEGRRVLLERKKTLYILEKRELKNLLMNLEYTRLNRAIGGESYGLYRTRIMDRLDIVDSILSDVTSEICDCNGEIWGAISYPR